MFELKVYENEDLIISRRFEERPSSIDKQDAVEAAGGDFYAMGEFVCSVRKIREE